jgi:hypothetical protein
MPPRGLCIYGYSKAERGRDEMTWIFFSRSNQSIRINSFIQDKGYFQMNPVLDNLSLLTEGNLLIHDPGGLNISQGF